MSDLPVFVIGVFIFAITVYGTIMAGGIALTRRAINEDPELEQRLGGDDDIDATIPVKVKY